jgi:branched-chain amino acid transport system substrate-binding protein
MAAAALAAAGCGSSSNPSSGASATTSAKKQTGPIVIGAAVASTGFMVSYDKPDMAAFKIGMDEINARGGIDGRKLKLITEDTASTPAGAKKAAEDLIAKGAQIMLVTSNFDVGSPAGIAAQEKNILNFSVGAASPKYGVQGIGPTAFTPAPATYYEGAAMAQLLKDKGYKKAFMLDDTSLDYSSEQCVGFKEHAKEIGLPATGDSFKNGDKSIASQITKIKGSGADAVAVCSYTPGGATAVRQIRAAGVNLPLVSGIGMAGTYWLKAIPRLSNFYTVSSASMYGDDPDPKVNDFVEKFKAQNGEVPSTDAAVGGYSISEIIDRAVKQVGSTDGAKLAQAIESFKDMPLLMGPTTYTSTVHIVSGRPMKIIKYTNGKPAYAGTLKVQGDVDLHL